MRSQILFATALLAASACSAYPEQAPQPHMPTTIEASTLPPTTAAGIGQAAIEACLQQGSEYIASDRRIYPGDSTACTTYVRNMYDSLKNSPLYKPALTATGDYFGYTPPDAGRFQEASGIPTTFAFDSITVQTMRSELDRLAKPTTHCMPEDDAAKWSRPVLVDHLAALGAFTIKYPYASAPRTDLLDPTMSTDSLVTATSSLTHMAECNNIRFNVLDVHTGHAEKTLTGNTSAHVQGLGIDVRPFNGDKPMIAWSGQKTDPQAPEQWIINNPQALQAANVILNFFTTHAADYQEVIWTDGSRTVKNGVNLPNHTHGKVIDDTHHDHLHAAVKAKA